jgi:hypothetical protein
LPHFRMDQARTLHCRVPRFGTNLARIWHG